MKRQGEVEAEYYAAHSYIQKLQDEITEVLDGILTTDSPPCSPTPSKTRNPPPQPKPIPPPRSSSSNPHTPHLTPRTHGARAEDRRNIADTAGRKPSLEDVTNTQQADHRAVPEHDPSSGRKQLSRSFDAELYWTGRKISVEDCRHRPQKDEVHHSLTFGRRRRTSLGDYGERRYEASTVGRRVASLSAHRRSSLDDYHGDHRYGTKVDWARYKLSLGELKRKHVNVIREEHGDGTYGKTSKNLATDTKDPHFVDVPLYRSEDAAFLTSKDASSRRSSAEIEENLDESKPPCRTEKDSNASLQNPNDQSNTAEICRRARELRNSIAESIDKRKQCDLGLQEPVSSAQAEPPVPFEKPAALKTDQTTALCSKTQEPAETCLNKASTDTAASSQGVTKPSRVASSLCCVYKQEKGEEEKGEHSDPLSAQQEPGSHHHQAVTDIPHDHQSEAFSPGANSEGQLSNTPRHVQNRPTTLTLPVSQGGVLPLHPTHCRHNVIQPYQLQERRNFDDVLQSASETTESEEESPRMLSAALHQSSVDGTEKCPSTPVAKDEFSESESSGESGDDSESDDSSVRAVGEQGTTVDAKGARIMGGTDHVTNSLQDHSPYLRVKELQGHPDDVRSAAEQQGYVHDARNTELQGHNCDVTHAEHSGEGLLNTGAQSTDSDAKNTQLWRHTPDPWNMESQSETDDVSDAGPEDLVPDVRDSRLQGHVTDVRDTGLPGLVVDANDATVRKQRKGTGSGGEQPKENLQSTAGLPMTVCEQGVQLPLPQQDQTNDPSCPAPDHALPQPLPCTAGGPQREPGAEALQGAALDPVSQPQHHDTPSHLELPDLCTDGSLSQRESGQQAQGPETASLPAESERPEGVEVLKTVVVREEDSKASTSASVRSPGSSSSSSGSSRRDQESERAAKEEAGCGISHRQKDATQCLVNSLPHNQAVHCRDAEVQTMSDGTLSPAHFLPHVDTACQTSPMDCSPSASSSKEDLKSADVSPQQAEAVESPRITPETADAVKLGEEEEDLISFSDSCVPESGPAPCISGHVTDQPTRKQPAHFGPSHEVKGAEVWSDSKKRPSSKGKGHKQKNGGKHLTDHHQTSKTVVHKSENNQSKHSKSKQVEESQRKQNAQKQRDSSSGHSKKERKHANQRQPADSTPKPAANDKSDTTPKPSAAADKPASKSTASSEKQGKENFSFLPDEVPEMQVMVNSLTPVLQRRKSARRSNSHTGVSSSGEDLTSGCEDLHSMLASFTAPSPPQPERRQTRVSSDKKPPGSSQASSTLSSPQPGRDEAGSDRTAPASTLFIKPKYARTWHGPVQTGTGRTAAPKMGVSMVTSDPSSLTLGANARAGGQGYNTHVHTMPVISRTLLDALHKRYCSYQYSSGHWVPSLPFPPLTAAARSANASVPRHSPCPVPGVPAQKLNSEGESDTGTGSMGTSSESSPRTGHTQTSSIPSAGHQASSPAASASQKHNGQTKKEEIEAVEACQWLRAAGFPQYAQMFEDGLFPVDISDVQRDHDFLDSDSIQSVIRRLNILNTCSVMKIDAQPCKKAPEESDEEDQCALSSNWEYQKAVRRWSRKLEPELSVTEDLNLEPSVSHDSLLGEDSGSHTDESPVLESKMPHSTAEREQGPDSVRIQMDTEPPESIVEGLSQQDTHVSTFPISPKLRRAASERLKSALKKMESFKKKSKKYPANRNIVEISDPVVSDQEGMQAKLERLNCVDISPGGGASTPTPHLPPPPQESTPMDKGAKGLTSPDSSYASPMSPISPAPPGGPASVVDQSANSSTCSQADASSLSEYYSAHSQLLASFQACSDTNRRQMPPAARKNSDSSLVEIFLLPQDHKPGSFPRLLKNGYIDTTAPFQVPPNQTSSTSSLPHGGRGPAVAPPALRSRVSVYDNLSPGSPQHTFSASGFRKPEDIPEALSAANRQSQVLRSFSVSSGNQDVKMDLDMSSFAGMVRSQSASAATSLEREVASRRRGSDGVAREGLSGEVSGDRKLSAGIEELDAMLQILLKDISSLSSGCSVEEEVDSQDLPVASSAASAGPREVSFSIADHDGNLSTHSNAASIKEDGQLSQTSTLEEGSLVPSQSFTSAVDDSMEAEEGDMSSQDSSEEVDCSADETLERIIMEAHERRDSGVGSSLTRASRERTRKKMRWESFQKCHRPSRASRELQIGGLSVCQLLPLRQLSLLKLTSIMEKCSPTNRSQWSWSVPRFMKRHKAPQFSDKNVFGVPFTVMLQRSGQPLPQCVLYAMRYLRKTSHDAIGIFRKSGVRSRIQKLRDMVEACPDTVNFDELQPYDVADLLKQYFRELPECLLTNKLSDTFRSIFSHVPLTQRLEALQTAVVLLPEENREVLHCLLLFLGDIAEHADKHQMNASNLAVCFAPSLFNFMGSHGSNSPKRQRKGLGVPEQRELLEQKAVHECFTYMIIECKKLFMVPPSMYSRLHLSTLSNMEPVHLDEFYAKGKQPGPDYKAFGEEHIQILLKEAHDKNRGWAPVSVSVTGIEVLQRKPQDGHPMRQWKCSVEIEAPPIEVLNRILHERHKWDDDMLSWNVVERLDRHCDVFHYALNSMAPHPPRHFMVIRYWRPDLVKGACAMVSRSVEHSGWKGASEADYDQGVRAVELGSYYLMEPCGSGRSRLTYIARTDLRGRCPEWYNRVFGHLSANYLDRLRDSFRQEAEGPETKV